MDKRGAEWKIILKCIVIEAEREVIGRINVAGNRGEGWIIVNIVMYVLVA